MIRDSVSRHLRPAVFWLALALTPALSAADHKFTTPPTLSVEAITLVNLLEQAHYNRDAVHSSDYAEVVPDYMAALDPQHVFFLESDKDSFAPYGRTLYFNVDSIGNIDSAYQIFYVYEDRVTARVNWVFDELKKNFDFTTNETYRADRSKSQWLSTPAEADELWRKRLKFELLGEMLNKKTLAQAKEVVRKRYERMLKNVGELDGSDLSELYLTTIAQLYDPHSNYWSADTYEDFGIQMKLQLVGIGAVLGVEDDTCVVKEIVPGGPADLSHALKPNDKIIAVSQDGGEPVEIIGMKLRKIVDLIRGPKGSRVHLMVEPAEATDSSVRKEVVIVRDVVKLNSARARGAVFQVPGSDGKTVPLGVITLPAFYGPADDGDTDAEKTSASQDVAKLVTQLKGKGIQGLVLDLRHNGGGFLSEAIELAGLFIHAGPVVQVKDYSGHIDVDAEKGEHLMYDGPMAVLVDRFSASASEIVAGALQDYGRAILIGDSSTHGKGTVQTVLEMKTITRELANSPAKTGAAKITIQKFYLPDGASTQLKGVVPDIVLPSIDDYLPIGESDMPHALAWDKIPTSFFDGAPIAPKVLESLRQASLERQRSLEEFAFLRRNVDWFKSRQSQKLISLNLEERTRQKDADEVFRKAMEVERTKLAKTDYTYEEFRLGPPLPPRIVATPTPTPAPKVAAMAVPDAPAPGGAAAKPGSPAAPAAGAGNGAPVVVGPAKHAADLADDAKKSPSDDPDDPDDAFDDSQSDTYVKMDIPLREAFRVIDDAIVLGHNRQYWVSDHAPLAVAGKG